MKICKIDELKGSEILARPIMTSDYNILLSEGTVLKEEYISKLRELNIAQVYIQEVANNKAEEIVILKEEIENTFKEKVKSILEKHTYQRNAELMELCGTADSIIEEIITEENVMEQVFDIKERSSDIYEHSISICSLAILTALKLGIEKEKIHDIGVGCLLHEIGLRYITVEYNNINVSELSQEEITEYKKHPIYGYSALRNENWISNTVKNIVLYHHEKLNGTGYPLHAKEISMECRIVNVCDSFDEMICGIGRERVKVHEAVEYIKNGRGTSFDPQVVDEFLNFTAVYPAGSFVVTNEGEVGMVMKQNKEFPNRPVIQIIKDKDGNRMTTKVIKDLTLINHIFIEKVLD